MSELVYSLLLGLSMDRLPLMDSIVMNRDSMSLRDESIGRVLGFVGYYNN
jgi:hypothetical protein